MISSPYHGGFLLGVSPILLLFPVEGIQDGAYACSAVTCGQAERMQDKHLRLQCFTVTPQRHCLGGFVTLTISLFSAIASAKYPPPFLLSMCDGIYGPTPGLIHGAIWNLWDLP